MNRQPNSNPRPSTIEIGKQAESRAERFLLTKGLQLICRNYRCRWGEIDLIMKDKDELVFVEVRFRKYNAYGGALESIDYFKQKKIERAAQHYIQRFYNDANIPTCRIDVVAIEGETLHWIDNIS